jgi:hypothetical protein
VAAVSIWLAALCVLLLAALLPRARAALALPHVTRAIVIAAALTLVTAAAQAPVMRVSPIIPYTLERFLFEALAGSRFYYLPFVGLTLLLAALADCVGAALAPGRSVWRIAAMCLAAGAAIGLAASSRTIGRAWAAYPLAHGEVELRQAADMLAARRDLAPGCKIYLLDLPSRAGPARGMLDTGVKRWLPRGHPAVGCFIQSEHAPWYHLVASAGLPPDAHKPLETILFGGRPFPPLAISNLSYYYLKAGDAARSVADPRAIFYAYDGKRFVDVTRDVREGRRTVHFYDNRPPY